VVYYGTFTSNEMLNDGVMVHNGACIYQYVNWHVRLQFYYLHWEHDARSYCAIDVDYWIVRGL